MNRAQGMGILVCVCVCVEEGGGGGVLEFEQLCRLID